MRYNLDYLLPLTMYRSRQQLILSFVVRYLVTQLAFLELFQSILFNIYLYLIIISRFSSIFQVISLWKPNPVIFYQVYKTTLIVFKAFVTMWEFGPQITFSMYFVLVVSLLWGCIKMPVEEVGLILFSWFVFHLVCLIVLGVVNFKPLCVFLDNSSSVLHSFRTQTKLVYRDSPCKLNRLTMLSIFSQMDIRLNYPLIGYLGRPFLVSFYNMLVLRTFDAILVVSKTSPEKI